MNHTHHAFRQLLIVLLCGTVSVSACGNNASSKPNKTQQPVAAPAEVVASPSFSNAHLQKLINLNKTDGFDAVLGDDIADALKLGAAGKTIRVRQLTVKKSEANAVSFSQFQQAIEGYVFAGQNATGTYIFYLDEKLNLVAAAKRKPNESATGLTFAEARNDFLAVMQIWARLADNPPTTSIPAEPTGLH